LVADSRVEATLPSALDSEHHADAEHVRFQITSLF